MHPKEILLAHGSGGQAMESLLQDLIFPRFREPLFARGEDCAIVSVAGLKLALSTDTYVVDPIFFPGGNIGCLAINGTVNDLAMRGAKPLYLCIGLVLEEGLSIEILDQILNSIQEAAQYAGVQVVTGDTKVVPRGGADKIFINAAGLGLVEAGVDISIANARVGDQIIINGSIAEHGIAVICQRQELHFESTITSDTAPLNRLVQQMLDIGDGLHVLHDPTRGGISGALNEIARRSSVGIVIEERDLPIKPMVATACDLLGFDPLWVANEGKLLAFVHPKSAEKILKIMHKDKYGQEARIIGHVTADHPGRVYLHTAIGGSRVIDMPSGELLPRIC